MKKLIILILIAIFLIIGYLIIFNKNKPKDSLLGKNIAKISLIY